MNKVSIKFGVDIGNSAVKGVILSPENKFLAKFVEPSAVATIPDAKYLTFSDDTERYFQVINSPLKAPATIFAIGNKAVALPDYQEFDVTSTSYKANHELTTALLFGTLLETLEKTTGQVPDQIKAPLAVSVPIVEAKSIGLIDQYKTLLNASHMVRVYFPNHTSRDVTITFSPTVVLNEGQAGFFGLLDTIDQDFQNTMTAVYNHLGESENPISSLEDFLIVDIGEGTTDLAVFRNKKFNPDYSYSVTKGYGNLLEEAIAKAARENLTVESRKDLQATLASNNRRRQERKKLWETYVTPTKDRFIQTLVDTILKTYGTRDYFDAIIFIGGGFTALTKYSVSLNVVGAEDRSLFDRVNEALAINNKHVDLLFGVPDPYARTINERGLTQVLTTLK